MPAASILLAMGILAAGKGAAAAYPSPARIGFHHCVLVYDKLRRSSRDFAPYVADPASDRPQAWMFDAFLFLALRTPSGHATTTGAATKKDWAWLLDRWFTPGRDLSALDTAIAHAADRCGPPPSPRQVILGIPRPNRAVADFGDVTDAGRSENLGDDRGVRNVLHWYVTQAVRRFSAAHYRRLHLWGFYWIHETVPPEDEFLVRTAAAEIHAAGYRFFWIPWFRARGWSRWREMGFDTAVLQPNYAFFSRHHGLVRRDRLALAAQLAAAHGMGVEIELPMATEDPRTRFYLLRYLADGAPQRYGYQAGVTAWYLGRDSLERLYAAKKAHQRQLYRAIARFLHGESIPDPDPHPKWHVAKVPAPSLDDGNWILPQRAVSTAIGKFSTIRWVNAVDAALPPVASPAAAWCGLIVADVRKSRAAPWREAGWAFGPLPTRETPWRLVTIPVRKHAAALRLRFLTADALTPATPAEGVCELRIDGAPADAALVDHLARGRPYEIRPAFRAMYGDSGRELTDGVVPEDGYRSGKTVGWHGRDVAITFRFARMAHVRRVDVMVEGGGYAGIHWPAAPLLLLQQRLARPPRRADTGSAPHPAVYIPGNPVQIERWHASDAATGRIVFRPPNPVPAKFATVFLQAVGWLMVSEIRIFAGGKNIAPSAQYTVHPAPDPDGTERYADDGARLTDGRIARSFSPSRVTGWHDRSPRSITIDLGIAQPVRRVIVWSLGGGRYGIHAPSAVVCQSSSDRTHWQLFGRSHRRSPAKNPGNTLIAAVSHVLESNVPVTARYLRLTVRPSSGWTLLSEIVVE